MDGHPHHHGELPIDPDVEADAAERDLARTTSVLREARLAIAARADVLVLVAAGGALGSVARWGVGRLLAGPVFPWATLLVNVLGGFALGLLVVWVVELRPRSRYLRPFAGVGLLGGFTTFSTYALDTRTLLADGRAPLAALYLLGTLLVGLLAVWFGMTLAWRAVAAARGAEERR